MTRALRDQRRVTRRRASAAAPTPDLGPAARRLVFCGLAIASGLAGLAAHEPALGIVERHTGTRFAIASLEVAGLATIPDAVLRTLVAERAGVARASIDADAIVARLENHPRIAAAGVSTAIPGKLLVWGQERHPVARARSRPAGPEDPARWWVDSAGMPFEPRDVDLDETELPLLVTREVLTAGVRSARLASALGSLQQFRRAGFAVAEWHLEGRGGATAPVVYLRGAVAPLLLGRGDPALQMRSLTRALALGQIRDAGAIDLRFRDQVIFWPAASDVAAAGKRASPGG